ncbi:MAG: glycine cleavage system protein H, partial [Acidobacteria bacterium ACB2]|nr:glycine cleavage system protein H [Acidobacteria bacterium ACB2]
AARLPQPVGVLAQDGGTPVAGVAREIDPERWDELVRSFLLTA